MSLLDADGILKVNSEFLTDFLKKLFNITSNKLLIAKILDKVKSKVCIILFYFILLIFFTFSTYNPTCCNKSLLIW